MYLFLGIRPHRFFHRDGADIHCRVPVPMTTATLGGEVEVPTIEGKLARVVSWYDNEWGFSNRMIDTAGVMAKFL